MSVIEDYLNSIGLIPRIQEHADAMQQMRDTDPGVLQAARNILPILNIREGLAGLGLGLEATGNIGESLAGLVSTAASYVPTTNDATAETARRVREAGFAHPLRAQEAARTGPDSLWAWLAGGLGMAADPTNAIAFPVGKAADAAKADNIARMLAARAGFSDDFAKDSLTELSTKLDELASTTMGDIQQQDILAKLRQPQDIFGRQAEREGLLANYQPTDTSPLEEMLANAGDVYAQSSAAKQAAVQPIAREMLQTTGPRGGKKPIPRGAIGNLRANPTPEYLQRVEEAKNASMLQGPGLPRRGETPAQYKAGLRGMIQRLQDEDQQALDEIRNALYKPERSAITPEEADILVGGDVPKISEKEAQRLLRSGDLGDLNARFNAEELATAKPNPEMAQALGEEVIANPPALTPEEELLQEQGSAARAIPMKNGVPSPEPYGAQPGVPSQPYGPPTQFAGNVTKRQRIEEEVNSLVNNPVAADGSRPDLEPSNTGRMWDLIKFAVKEGIKEQKAAYNRPFSNQGLTKKIGSVWSGINIETTRNLFMDEIFSRWVLRNEGIAKRAMEDNRRAIIEAVTSGEKKPWKLFGSLGDHLQVLGKITEKNADNPAFAKEIERKLGGSAFELEADTARQLDEMNLMEQALIGTGVQLASPTRAVTGIPTALGNLAIPFRRKVFRIINNVTHNSARVAAYEQAFAPFIENSADDLLKRAASEGLDVTPLMDKPIFSGGEAIAQQGGFSSAEVKAALGERYAKEWERMSDMALDAGYANSKRVLGNYQLDGAAGATEKMIRKFVPFMSWSWRAYPRAAKYALQHPAVTTAILHLYAADRQQAEAEGRPDYQVGTVAINKDTPFLGLLASVFTPEQESEIRLNPLALFSPVGGNLLGAGMEDESQDTTFYQKANDALGLLGGSFNPYVQAGAYITGQDWRAPGNASRYSPIDQFVGNATGLEVPTIQGPLRALRAGVTESLGDRQEDNYDPVVAKANELVLEATGKPVSAPENKGIALDIRNKGSVYKEAERLLLEGNAKKAAFNSVSPQSVMVTTETKKEQRAAGDVPFSYEDIKAAQENNLPTLVRAMKAANEEFLAGNPAAAVQKKPEFTSQELMDPRLAKWEAQNATLKRLAPKSYAAARKEFIDTLGIH